jgi:hypothetical protein
MATFPTAVPAFPTRAEGQTFYADHVNALQNEVAAIATKLLAPPTLPVASPLTVVGTQPTFTLKDGTATLRLIGISDGTFDWAANANWVGSTWIADDVAVDSLLLRLGSDGRVTLFHAPAGAASRVFTPVWVVVPPGRIYEVRRGDYPLGEWHDYAPTWTSTGTQPVVGNGFFYGRYTLVGKTVFARMILNFGSTTTGGTGDWRFGLPIACAAGGGEVVGTGRAFTGGLGRNFLPILITATEVSWHPNGSAIYASAGNPGPWAAGHNIHMTLVYNHF